MLNKYNCCLPIRTWWDRWEGKEGKKEGQVSPGQPTTATKGVSTVDIKGREAILTSRELLNKKGVKSRLFSGWHEWGVCRPAGAMRWHWFPSAPKSNLRLSFHLQSNRWKSLHRRQSTWSWITSSPCSWWDTEWIFYYISTDWTSVLEWAYSASAKSFHIQHTHHPLRALNWKVLWGDKTDHWEIILPHGSLFWTRKNTQMKQHEKEPVAEQPRAV